MYSIFILLHLLLNIVPKECISLLILHFFLNFTLTNFVIYRDNLVSVPLSSQLPGPPLCSGSSCLGLVAWLSPLDPKSRHRDIQDHRVEGVGEWLLQTEEFRSWQAGSRGGGSDNAVLFCYGDPGVGKTYIR